MYAQRAQQTPFRPRNNYNRRAPIRARLGLAMRRSMTFGPLGDIEPMMQAQGLALAPISTGDASMSIGGVTVLATATAGDIDNGALKGLVLPGGMADEAGVTAITDLLGKAQEKGLPVLAFGEGVVHAARAAGADPADFHDTPAVLVEGRVITALSDSTELSAAASRIG